MAGPPPGFDLNESFTLGKNTNGINPVTEKVTLQIGTFSVTIPPSWRRAKGPACDSPIRMREQDRFLS